VTAPVQAAIKAAMSVAKDVAEGRLSPAQLEQAAVEEMSREFGTVGGPDHPAADLQLDVARQILAAGRIPADELAEWLAVTRSREASQTTPIPNPGTDSAVSSATDLSINPAMAIPAQASDLPMEES
jgi:hypothetical protein